MHKPNRIASLRSYLDKTGTITVGKPTFDRAIAANGFSEQQILSWAAGLDRTSEHPLARAVVAGAEVHGSKPAVVTDSYRSPGRAFVANPKGVLSRWEMQR